MKIGYPCINKTLKISTSKTLRLASYTHEKLINVINQNIEGLYHILRYNKLHDLLFFRISSCFIPFASHSINTFNWEDHFKPQFELLGEYIKKNNFRISMHPDQFIVLNSPHSHIVHNSIEEIAYHARLLDALQLDQTAKIQIHVGGVYGDKKAALKKFIATYHNLDSSIKRRLVIENDDKLYSANDCLEIYEHTGIPIIYDTLHFECLNNVNDSSNNINYYKESMINTFSMIYKTWTSDDGIPMVDYSSQDPEGKKGKHSSNLDEEHFKKFIEDTKSYDFDIMMEIKNKEISALKALSIIKNYKYYKSS